MRLFVILFFASLLIGCGSGDHREKTGEVRLGFSLDTVMVDPGQEILFLNSGLNQAQLSPDRKHLYNFNPADFSIEKINLDELKFEDKINFSKEGPNGLGQYVMGTSEYVKYEGGKVILGAEVSSDLYVYDPLTEALDQRAFESELTANEKKGNHPGKVSDRKEMEGIYRKIHEEIGFQAIHWDEKNDLYYRFSSMAEFSDTAETPENRMVPSPTGAKVYLTVFDKDLNQIAESRVPMLTKKPAYHFVKDGKIWIFENMEDEMGFVRLSVDL